MANYLGFNNPVSFGYAPSGFGYNYQMNPLNQNTGFSPNGIDQIVNPTYYNSIFNQQSMTGFNQFGAQNFNPYGAQSFNPYGAQSFNPYGAQSFNPYGAQSYMNPPIQNNFGQFGTQSLANFNQSVNFGSNFQDDSVLGNLFAISDILMGNAVAAQTGAQPTTTDDVLNNIINKPATEEKPTTTTNTRTGLLSNFQNNIFSSVLGGMNNQTTSLASILSGTNTYNDNLFNPTYNTNGKNDLGIVAENPLNASSMYGVSMDWSLQSQQGDRRLQQLMGGLNSLVSSPLQPTISPGNISWDRSMQGDIQLNNILAGIGNIFGGNY